MVLKYSPINLVIDQTVLCNQECFFCWRSDREKVRQATEAAPYLTMPMDLYREIVDQGAANGLRELSLCGPMGEPSLVPTLVERGLYAKGKGYLVRINTNGTNLHKHPGLTKAFDVIIVSLDAVDPTVYESIHGRPHHERVLKNIENLLAHRGKCDVRVRFTANEKNREHMPDVLAQSWRVLVKDVHSFIDVVDGVDGDAAQCNQPQGTVNYTYTGLMTTCCINYKLEPTFGHITEGLQECWEGPAFEAWRERRLSGLCSGCSGLGPYIQKRTAKEAHLA